MPRFFLAAAAAVVAVFAFTARPADATAASTAKDACVKLFERQRTCTDQFIPALVDLRVSVDKPKGIAAEGTKPGGRDSLIKKALEEWKNDSTDASIDSLCTRMSSSPKAATLEPITAQCVPSADCSAFVKCVIPMMKPTL